MSSLPVLGLICGVIGCWAARRDIDRLWAWATVTLMTAFARQLRGRAEIFRNAQGGITARLVFPTPSGALPFAPQASGGNQAAA